MANDNYEVGYGKPPRWARFKKGESGNPRGRPKKKRDVDVPAISESAADDLLRSELSRAVPVTDASGRQDITMLQLITRSQAAAAAKGNVHAQRDILRQARELEERDAMRRAAEQADERAIFKRIVQWKSARVKEWQAAEAEGREPEQPWPHPDDILIDEKASNWRVRGPVDESDVPMFRYFQAQRDCEFARWILRDQEKSVVARGYLRFCLIWDLRLPKRWQINGNPEAALNALDRMTLRQLRKHLEAMEQRVEELRVAANIPPPDKECYRAVNKILKPLLKLHGYRSLAEFERANQVMNEAVP